MSEPGANARPLVDGARSPLLVTAAITSFVSVLAVVLIVVVPGADQTLAQPVLRTGLSVVALSAVGMTVGILGSRGMTSPRRSVRIAWRGAALVGLATTCLSAVPTLLPLGAQGIVLAVILWAGAGTASFFVVGTGAMAATPAARTWALASPWLALAGSGILAAAVTASFEVAANLLFAAVTLVAIGAVGLVPGLLVRESVGSLRHESLARRLAAGRRAPNGVWLVLAVKAVTTLVTVAVVAWRWNTVPDARSWVSGCGLVLILILVLALDHRFPVFGRHDSRVATGVGILVSLPLIVVVVGALALLTIQMVVRSPGPPGALLLLIVAVVALRRGSERLGRWRVLFAAPLIGGVCGAAALASVAALPGWQPANLTGPFLAVGLATALGFYAVELLILLAVAAARRAWKLPIMVAALTVWVVWGYVAGGQQRGWTTNLLLSAALPVLLVLHARGRQKLVDAGEILRFGLTTVIVVDLPSLLVVLPEVVAPWVLALGLAGSGVALVVGTVKGTIRLRSVAFIGAVFGPLLAARLMAPILDGGDLAAMLEGLAGLLIGLIGLPLAALISAASAQTNVHVLATSDQPVA